MSTSYRHIASYIRQMQVCWRPWIPSAATSLAVQPSLLRGAVVNKPVPRRYDLGMDDLDLLSEAFEKRKPLFLEQNEADG